LKEEIIFLINPSQLTVLATNQCTARCIHCSLNCGPEYTDQLSFEQIRKAIHDFHSESPLRVVIFSGGEPTLLGEDLLNSIAYADSLGINTRLVTNAHWAGTQEMARGWLVALREAGLAELNISTDDYHIPYIPFDRVRNAWHTSKGLGFKAIVIANSSDPDSRISPRFIMEQLGEELSLRYDDKGREKPLGRPDETGTLKAISNANIQMLGRAKETIDAGTLRYPASQSDLHAGCACIIRDVALSPNNHLLACCGMEAEGNRILDLGNASHASVSDLLYRNTDSLIINSVALMGPMFLKRLIQKNEPGFPFRSHYSSMCEICEHLFTWPEAIAVLQRYRPVLEFAVSTLHSQMNEAPSEKKAHEDTGGASQMQYRWSPGA